MNFTIHNRYEFPVNITVDKIPYLIFANEAIEVQTDKSEIMLETMGSDYTETTGNKFLDKLANYTFDKFVLFVNCQYIISNISANTDIYIYLGIDEGEDKGIAVQADISYFYLSGYNCSIELKDARSQNLKSVMKTQRLMIVSDMDIMVFPIITSSVMLIKRKKRLKNKNLFKIVNKELSVFNANIEN